jgi:hypothetical protein
MQTRTAQQNTASRLRKTPTQTIMARIANANEHAATMELVVKRRKQTSQRAVMQQASNRPRRHRWIKRQMTVLSALMFVCDPIHAAHLLFPTAQSSRKSGSFGVQ